MPRQYTRRSPIERFWEKVDKTPECWEWTACRTTRGYGKFRIEYGNEDRLAHRIAWELTNGPIPDGLWVLHRCDNRACVNPDHLFLGTHQDNMRDMALKGRAARGSRNGARLSPETHVRGERSPHARLTEQQVRDIRRLSVAGVPFSMLAAGYGVSWTQIKRIVNRESWKHV